ncbi:MAG: hypothetical protein LBI06_02400, partial [Treponema sp.]|nr:hypothetical protein [Treponema sp.]
KKLRGLGLADARIFFFYTCGTGDTFLFSSTVDYLLKINQRPGINGASQTIGLLREKAINTAHFLHFKKILLAPTPFSDDAGFLQGGLPVQTITMLPDGEAKAFACMLREHPDFVDMLIGGSTGDNNRDLLPETWRCLNSASDSHLRLTPEFFDHIVRFAVEICRG